MQLHQELTEAPQASKLKLLIVTVNYFVVLIRMLAKQADLSDMTNCRLNKP